MHYGELKKCDIANGEGVRVSLFVSGCRNHCKDCFQPETWDFCYGRPFTEETEQEIYAELDKPYVGGLSLLGGDPFEPETQRALLPMLRRIREKYPKKNIWCYTGYQLEELLTPGEADEAAMDEGGEIEGFTSYWDERTGRTDYILLAEIPVKEPWQAMAWLPMGGWNNCPTPFAMMMTARRWYEEYGAWPAAVSHDILEFAVEQPVPRERCLELAAEQGIFCPERVLTCGEDASLGRLAGDLMRSNIWFFIWD